MWYLPNVRAHSPQISKMADKVDTWIQIKKDRQKELTAKRDQEYAARYQARVDLYVQDMTKRVTKWLQDPNSALTLKYHGSWWKRNCDDAGDAATKVCSTFQGKLYSYVWHTSGCSHGFTIIFGIKS